MKKRILVYGDSNTWGDRGPSSDGKSMGRFATEQQWPNILQKLLGDNYEVIQEGLCGRVAGNCDTDKPYRNGGVGYEIALRSASPINYAVIALGPNDLKERYGLSREQVVDNLAWYDKFTREYTEVEQGHGNYIATIYVGIANIRPNRWINTPYDEICALNNSLADRVGQDSVVVPSDLRHGVDGVHYTAEDHERVADMVYQRIKKIVN